MGVAGGVCVCVLKGKWECDGLGGGGGTGRKGM